MSGLPPQFNLDFSHISKESENQKMPPLAINKEGTQQKTKLLNLGGPKPDQNAATLQPKSQPGKTRLLLQAANQLGSTFAKQSKDDDSDVDLDDDLQEIPIGKDDANSNPPSATVIEAPKVQMAQLPELQDDNDDDEQKSSSKYSLLYDLMLTPDQYNEDSDTEWTYKSFIRQFAKKEANLDDDNDIDTGEDYQEEEDDNIIGEEEENLEEDDD